MNVLELFKEPNFWFIALTVTGLFLLFRGVKNLPSYKKCKECKTFTTVRNTEHEAICKNCIENLRIYVINAENRKKDELCNGKESQLLI